MSKTPLGEPFAAGRTAEVYEWDEGRVLKLLFEGLPVLWLEREAILTNTVREAGAPAPAFHDQVRVHDRDGVVIDRVTGSSMLSELQAKPWRFAGVAQRFANIHADLFTHRTNELPSVKDQIAAKIEKAPQLTTKQRRAARDTLAALPNASSVLHGDYHPDNVFETGLGPILIDWTEASHGHPAADIARTLITLSAAAIPPDFARRRITLGFIGVFRRRYLRTCLARTGLTAADVAAWELPVTAARLSEQIEHETTARLGRVTDLLS